MKSIILEGNKVQISDESFEELKKSLIKEERWLPEEGDIFWTINTNGEKDWINWIGEPSDYFRLGQNNVYKNKESLEAHAKKLQAISKITNYCWENGLAKKWVKKEENWYFYLFEDSFKKEYEFICKKLLVLPYLKSKEACEEVIEKFEDELKLIFEV